MSRPIVSVLVSLALATACGGKSSNAPTTNTSGATATGAAATPATPFDPAAVKAAMASLPGLPSCDAEPTTTMGAYFAGKRADLSSDDSGLEESFECAAQGDDLWECQWSVFTEPAAADPEDPCAEGGGSGFQIIARVGADGALVPDQIYCNAPG